MKDVLILSGP